MIEHLRKNETKNYMKIMKITLRIKLMFDKRCKHYAIRTKMQCTILQHISLLYLYCQSLDFITNFLTALYNLFYYMFDQNLLS